MELTEDPGEHQWANAVFRSRSARTLELVAANLGAVAVGILASAGSRYLAMVSFVTLVALALIVLNAANSSRAGIYLDGPYLVLQGALWRTALDTSGIERIVVSAVPGVVLVEWRGRCRRYRLANTGDALARSRALRDALVSLLQDSTHDVKVHVAKGRHLSIGRQLRMHSVDLLHMPLEFCSPSAVSFLRLLLTFAIAAASFGVSSVALQ